MRASTITATVVLAVLAMFGTAFVIFRLPFVPNWPYVGLVCLGLGLVAGGIYLVLARRRLTRPTPVTVAWLLRVFPVWLSVFTAFWSFGRFTIEKNMSVEFSHGVVVEKYRSQNHGYLSVRVEVADRAVLTVEDISPAAWEEVSVGSQVSKRCGTTDITLENP